MEDDFRWAPDYGRQVDKYYGAPTLCVPETFFRIDYWRNHLPSAHDVFTALLRPGRLGPASRRKSHSRNPARPGTTDIKALVQPTLHAEGYPDLSEVLGKIGRDCVADGIGVRQLRRTAFFRASG